MFMRSLINSPECKFSANCYVKYKVMCGHSSSDVIASKGNHLNLATAIATVEIVRAVAPRSLSQP